RRARELHIGYGAHADENHVGGFDFSTIELHALHTVVSHTKSGNARLKPELDALALVKALNESRNRRRGDACEQTLLALDHDDVHALDACRGRHLEPDETAADHDEALSGNETCLDAFGIGNR